ncbi:hypothetical protein [Stackebrandtia albiflava]|nr:hypothetical protein [Stackebrandtia albiflava]
MDIPTVVTLTAVALAGAVAALQLLRHRRRSPGSGATHSHPSRPSPVRYPIRLHGGTRHLPFWLTVAAVPAAVAATGLALGGRELWQPAIMCGVVTAAALVVAAFAVLDGTRLTVHSDSVTVRRRFRSLTVPRGDVRHIGVAPDDREVTHAAHRYGSPPVRRPRLALWLREPRETPGFGSVHPAGDHTVLWSLDPADTVPPRQWRRLHAETGTAAPSGPEVLAAALPPESAPVHYDPVTGDLGDGTATYARISQVPPSPWRWSAWRLSRAPHRERRDFTVTDPAAGTLVTVFKPADAVRRRFLVTDRYGDAVGELRSTGFVTRGYELRGPHGLVGHCPDQHARPTVVLDPAGRVLAEWNGTALRWTGPSGMDSRERLLCLLLPFAVTWPD